MSTWLRGIRLDKPAPPLFGGEVPTKLEGQAQSLRGRLEASEYEAWETFCWNGQSSSRIKLSFGRSPDAAQLPA